MRTHNIMMIDSDQAVMAFAPDLQMFRVSSLA